MNAILRTEGLTKNFRGLVATQDIDFVLNSGAVHCIIGPNGAGKTTFISMISGHLTPTAGRVIYKDNDITRQSVIQRARIGITRKFQTPSVFEHLNAYENIELSTLRGKATPSERERHIGQVLEAVRLVDDQDTPAAYLSHGQRQWLEIGLLLGASAQLLLLDEPTAGMTAEETAATGKLINRLAQERNLSVIIIEHDINFVRGLTASITVLHLGRVLKEGSFDEIARDEQVREVYLGG